MLYNLPERDCNADVSSGELTLANDGLSKYKHAFVDPYAAALAGVPDASFAVVLEPDSLGNVITDQNVGLCRDASGAYGWGRVCDWEVVAEECGAVCGCCAWRAVGVGS